MERKEYNGWFNYETWLCKLWLDDDRGTYELQKEWSEDIRERFEGVDTRWMELSTVVKDYIEESNPCPEIR